VLFREKRSRTRGRRLHPRLPPGNMVHTSMVLLTKRTMSTENVSFVKLSARRRKKSPLGNGHGDF